MSDDPTALRAQLSEPTPEAQRAALAALGELVRQDTLAPDAELLAELVPFLSAEQPVCGAAATAIGWIAERGLTDASALPQLLSLLGAAEGPLRHDAAWILENSATKGTVEPAVCAPLLETLAHEDVHARAAAVYCLGTYLRLGHAPEGTRERVEALSEDADPGVRDAVGHVFRKKR